MDDKKAVLILKKLLRKYSLAKEEKEAVLAAIGMLSWTSLAKSRLKAQARKRSAKQVATTKWQ